MNISRRGFIGGTLGAVAAAVVSPVVKALPKALPSPVIKPVAIGDRVYYDLRAAARRDLAGHWQNKCDEVFWKVMVDGI